MIGFGLACLIGLGWIAISGALAARHFEDMRASMQSVQDDLGSEQYEQAAAGLVEVGEHAAAAERRVGGAPWTWLVGAPFVGPSIEAAVVLAQSADAVLDPLAPAAAALLRADPASISDAAQLLEEQRSGLTEASDAMSRAKPAILALESAQAVGPLREPIKQVQDNVDAAADALQGAAGAAAVLPRLFGFGGSSEWVLVASQPAEARGSGGGYFGAFAVVRAKEGRLKMSARPNDDLEGVSVDLSGTPQGFTELWGKQVANPWAHNLTRHYPYAADLIRRSAESQGVSPEYVLALDPFAVASILNVTGPITSRGVTLDSDSAGDYLTSTIYQSFPDPAEKDKVLLAFMEALFDSLQESAPSPVALGRALLEPIQKGQLVLWSSDPELQRSIEAAEVGGVVPAGGSTITVAINNTAGGKMDAFLDSSLRYTLSDSCLADLEGVGRPGEVVGQVELNLRLNVPDGMPPYVVQRLDGPGPYGSSSVSVHVYGPEGAVLTGFTIDGKPTATVMGVEREHPVWGASVELPPKSLVKVQATFAVDGDGVDDLRVMAQPMVRPTEVETRDQRACGQ